MGARRTLAILKCILLISTLCAGSTVATAAAVTVDVAARAVTGSGTASDPWKGWDSGIAWQSGTTYRFRSGWYGFDQPLTQWALPDIALLGEPNTVLLYTGAQNPVSAVVSLDASAASPHVDGVRMENFIIDGNGQAVDGLYVNAIRGSQFNYIRIRGVTGVGFDLVFSVLNTFISPRVNERSGVLPAVMMRMDRQASNYNNFSSANTIMSPIFEGNSAATGFDMRGQASQNVIIGGTVEGVGTGISLCTDGSLCSRNTFTNIDLECNSSADIIVGLSESNQFNNVLALSSASVTYCGSGYTGPTGSGVQLTSASRNNQFIGGQYASILERGKNNSFINIGTQWSNIDSFRINTAFINVRDLMDSTSRTLLPLNSSIGRTGQMLQNLFTTTATGLTFPAAASGSGVSTQSVPVANSNTTLTGGAVAVSYSGPIPDDFLLDGYLDPANPANVIIRWKQVSGSTQAPPAGGTYKIVVFQ